ncbi:MAG: hypothetical protein JOZ11_13385 [Alphaproteobacteria bacterium]|nr:hypothetical protein [Alphaproteobacteria bacterium]
MLQAGETPNLEAALVKDLGNAFERERAAIAVAADRPSASLAIAAAKIRAGEAAGKVAEIAHQVHGATAPRTSTDCTA